MKQFESEIRIKIKDFLHFEKKLYNLNGEIIEKYSFIDYIFLPIKEINWDLKTKCMRIREYIGKNESKILFSHIKIHKYKKFQFKQSVYPGGKLNLYTGNRIYAENILKDLGFKHSFTIEKSKGYLYKIPKTPDCNEFIIALEEITYWRAEKTYDKKVIFLAELEVWADTYEEISNIFKNRLEILQIPNKEILSDSVPYYLSKKLKI
ncbi:MAG: hypothetical protein ACTSWR_12185 [Candidatus Helarchaeota archaeon]